MIQSILPPCLWTVSRLRIPHGVRVDLNLGGLMVATAKDFFNKRVQSKFLAE
jgi:hypothetical protein